MPSFRSLEELPLILLSNSQESFVLCECWSEAMAFTFFFAGGKGGGRDRTLVLTQVVEDVTARKMLATLVDLINEPVLRRFRG